MKIALIGATGFVGQAILEEGLARGHQVTALVRHPEKLAPRPGLVAKKADALDEAALAKELTGHDVVVSAYNPGWAEPKIRELSLKGTRSIINGVKRAGIKRLVVVGGAGSLEVAPGLQLIDTPEFPKEWQAGALGMRDALVALREEHDLAWSFLSPAAVLKPGERTGTYRLGSDQLLRDAEGESQITTADLAVALLDEVETPKHVQRRFTVAY